MMSTIMSEAMFQGHCDENEGFCTHCCEITADGVEPDAVNYRCPDCKRKTVCGMEAAFELGFIELDEDSE